nr:hypothetical protein [Phyllobacterium brassicacearum]
MCTAINDLVLFDAMSDDPAFAMWTCGGKFLDRTFEAIERVGFVGDLHFESLIIVIPALIASGHGLFPPSASSLINLLRGDWFRIKAPSSVYLPKHDVERADDRRDVAQHLAAAQKVHCLQMGE